MKKDSFPKLSRELSDLVRAVELGMPRSEAEVAWLDLLPRVSALDSPKQTHLLSQWHFVGYMLHDRDQEFGLALHHYVKMEEYRPDWHSWAFVLLYSVFRAKSPAHTLRALEELSCRMPKGGGVVGRSVRSDVIEYLLLIGDGPVPKPMEVAIRKLWRLQPTHAAENVRGKHLVELLDPRGKIRAYNDIVHRREEISE